MGKRKLKRKLRRAEAQIVWLKYAIEAFWKPEEEDWLRKNTDLEDQVRDERARADRNHEAALETGTKLQDKKDEYRWLEQWAKEAGRALADATVSSARGQHVRYTEHDRLLRELRDLIGRDERFRENADFSGGG